MELSRTTPRRITFAVCLASLSLLSVASPRVASAETPVGELSLRARRRVETPAGSGRYAVVEETLSWKPEETAIIICDMWDKHWCEGATRRVQAMAPRMNRVVRAARKRGVFVIHAPSGTMEFYRDTPQRRLAVDAPEAATLPRAIDSWCSLDRSRESALPIDDSDGGCDTQPAGESRRVWSRQIQEIDIARGDAVSDRGSEIWNLLEARDVDNLIIMGVHTNMCVLGRPFGIRNMVRNGKNVVLVRDLTDAMYNPRRAPRTSHRRGTELVVEHVETYWCPTVLADDITGETPRPHAVFVIAEREYRTKDTLPAFAAEVLEPLGVRCTFRHVSPEDDWSIPGLDVLEDADLLVLSVRRRALPAKQLGLIRSYLDAGKPLVAIRTSSHAFDTRGRHRERDGFADWPTFDSDVLGGHYKGHHGNKGEDSPTRVWVSDGFAHHPILRGVPKGEFRVRSWLYKVRPLEPGAEALMFGRASDREPDEPVAWTNRYRSGRVFYTSLGHEEDFEIEAFRRLLLNGVFWALERAPSAAGD